LARNALSAELSAIAGIIAAVRQPMPTLEIELLGETTSFEVLRRLPMPDGICLERPESGWTLKESGFEAKSHEDVFNRALWLVEWLNAFGGIAEPSYRPISFASVHCGPHGTLASFGATVSVRDRDFLASNVSPPPPLTKEILAHGLKDADAREALRFYAASRDAFSLYKVLEIVSESLLPPRKPREGGRIFRALKKTDWIEPLGLASLLETLNNPTFAGEHARHGLPEPPRDPAARPLSLPDAEECVRGILLRWLAQGADRPKPE
jgi:hypothetical protein